MQVRYEDIDHRYASIKETAEERDYLLAELLMRAAFHNDDRTKQERGLGPLYLIQAWHLNRRMKSALQELI